MFACHKITSVVAAAFLTVGVIASENSASVSVKEEKAVKICKKTGKACTGKHKATHDCKQGDKECGKAQKTESCKSSAEKSPKICKKTGKACTGKHKTSHDCKQGDKACASNNVSAAESK